MKMKTYSKNHIRGYKEDHGKSTQKVPYLFSHSFSSVQIFMQLYQLKVTYYLKFVIILIVLAKVKSSEISNPLIYVTYLTIFQTFLSILWPWSVNIKNFNF